MRRIAALVAFCAGAVFAQQAPVSIPLIGCAADGQAGPVVAPEPGSISMPLSASAASELAYYRSGQGLGVLAPRGWFCFGTYGSGGQNLFVSPQPIGSTQVFSANWHMRGPAIEILDREGSTSGRYGVAEVIARVFPAYKSVVRGVLESFDMPTDRFPNGPYPKDKLTYRSTSLVEYTTPAQTEGLGTHSDLEKNDSTIYGVAMLVGKSPDLVQLCVRLPRDMTDLAPIIVHQAERDQGRTPQ